MFPVAGVQSCCGTWSPRWTLRVMRDKLPKSNVAGLGLEPRSLHIQSVACYHYTTRQYVSIIS